jgi:hypothetical protein
VKLLSVSTDANRTATINVTPLTDLVVRSFYGLKGQSADGAFADPARSPPPSPAQVKQVAQVLMESLRLAIRANDAPVTSAADLIAQPFIADHTGMDKLMDNARVTVHDGGADLVLGAGSATQSIRLALRTGSTAIQVDSVTTAGTATTASAWSDVVPVQPDQVDALVAIGATLASITSTVNARGTALAPEDLDPFFAPGVVNDGLDRAQFLREAVSSLAQGQRVDLQAERIRSLDVAGGRAEVQLRRTVGTAARSDSDPSFFERGSDGQWRWAGNGRLAAIRLLTEYRTRQDLVPVLAGPVVRVEVRAPRGALAGVSASSSFAIPVFQRDPPELTGAGLQLDVFSSETRMLAGAPPAVGTPVTVTLRTAAGGTVVQAVALAASTSEAIRITSPTGSAIWSGRASVQWSLPSTYVVQEVELTATVTTPERDPLTGSLGHARVCTYAGTPAGAQATTGTVFVPALCNDEPVTSVTFAVRTTGPNGERSTVMQVMRVGL